MAAFIAELSGGDPPSVPAPMSAPDVDLPAGRWQAKFSNGVTEVCEIQKDGAVALVEPAQIPGRKVAANSTSVVITFEKGQVQRWTPIGDRVVIEHWFPGAPLRMETAKPAEVLGLAQRVE
jgi:hypothetical protein